MSIEVSGLFGQSSAPLVSYHGPDFPQEFTLSDIVENRLANVFFANASVSEALAGEDHQGSSSLLPKAICRQIDAGRRRPGGLWVRGRAVLPTSTLSYTPDSMNQSVQATPENMEISIPLAHISTVPVH